MPTHRTQAPNESSYTTPQFRDYIEIPAENGSLNAVCPGENPDDGPR